MLTLTLMATDLFARAGGGGGGGGGGGARITRGDPTLIAIVIAICVPFFFAYNFYMNHRIARRRKQVTKALLEMSKVEPEWNEESLLTFAKTQFRQIQDMWGNQDLFELEKHLTKELFVNWKLQIEIQQNRGETNPLYGLVIHDAFIVDVKNYHIDNNDLFAVCFDAQGDDQIIQNGRIVTRDRSPFREFWIFRKNEGHWKLMGVLQVEGWKTLVDGNLVFERLDKPAA